MSAMGTHVRTPTKKEEIHTVGVSACDRPSGTHAENLYFQRWADTSQHPNYEGFPQAQKNSVLWLMFAA